MNNFKITINGNKAYIETPYSAVFVKRVKVLGGKWDSAKRSWVVPANAVDAVRSNMRDVYGRDDLAIGETLTLIITSLAIDSSLHTAVERFGKVLSSAQGRDSGARAGDDVFYLAGAPESGGSVKNWRSVVPANAKIELRNVSKKLFDEQKDAASEYYDITVVDEVRPNATTEQDKLRAERDGLMQRIAEIDSILDPKHTEGSDSE